MKDYIYTSSYIVISLVFIILTIYFYHTIQTDRTKLRVYQEYQATSSRYSSSAHSLEVEVANKQKLVSEIHFFISPDKMESDPLQLIHRITVKNNLDVVSQQAANQVTDDSVHPKWAKNLTRASWSRDSNASLAK